VTGVPPRQRGNRMGNPAKKNGGGETTVHFRRLARTLLPVKRAAETVSTATVGLRFLTRAN
jgi:hypothetical protein